MDEPIRIVLIEDSDDDAELIQRQLKRDGLRAELRRVETESEFRQQLMRFMPHIVIADLALPRYDGRLALNLMKRERWNLPFVFVSGSRGEELAVETLKQGATDYVLKHRLERLGPAIRRALSESREREQRISVEQQLKRRISYEMAASECLQLLTVGPLDHACMQRVLRLLLDTVQASRVYLFENEYDERLGECMCQREEVVGPSVEPQIANPKLARASYAKFAPTLLPKLLAHEPYVALASELGEPERSFLVEQEILSILVLPIFVGKQLRGFIGFDDCVSERKWAYEDIRLLQTVADAIGLANQRQHMEQSIRESEERLKMALRAGDLGTFDWNIKTGRIVWSSKHYEIFGYPPEEQFAVDFHHFVNRLHPEDRPRIEADIAAAREAKRPYSNEARILLPDGSVRWVAGRGEFYFDQQGNPERMVGTTQDITERKAIELRLQVSEERFKRIAHASNDAIWDWDLSTNVLWWGDGFFSLYGYERDEIPPHIDSWESRIHPDERQAVIDGIHAAIEFGPDAWQHEYRFQHKDGSWCFVLDRGFVFRDRHGNALRMYGGMTDLSQRHEVEQAIAELNADLERQIEERTARLSESERFNRATLDALSARVAVLDTDGCIVAVNRAWKDFSEKQSKHNLALTEGENYLVTCEGLGGNDADAAAIAKGLRKLISGAVESWSYEYPHPTENELRWFHCRASRFIHNDRPQVLVAHENITPMKLTQEALREAKSNAEQANLAKSDFLAAMSHELRTPLNGILGMNELLLASELDSRQRELIELSNSSGKLLLQLVNDILDLSKIEAGKLELNLKPLPIEELTHKVVEIVSPLATQKGLTLNFQVAPNASNTIQCDEARLQQVLINLLSNAIKFTDSGEVTLIVDRSRQDSAAPHLRFRVIDTGIGIPEQRQDRLFQLFSQVDNSTTRQHGGTGLGLSICREIISLMGGQIGVESQVGVGSTFWFEVPVEGESHKTERAALEPPSELSVSGEEFASGMEAEQIAQPPPLHGHVLVAEDNRINQMYILELLKHFGLTTELATNGEEAVAAVRERQFDLVLMDCQMPEVDGFTATRDIRRWESERGGSASLPIVALTANAMALDRQRCLDAGMDEYLAKPVDAGRTRSVLAKYLRSAQQPAGG